jgi:hypothetical protein
VTLADRLEITDLETGGVRTAEVRGEACFVTITTDGGVELAKGAAGSVLRLVRMQQGGYRLEPVAAGGRVTVNGEELFCKDLAAGDVVDLGRARLRWMPAPAARAAPGPPRPSARRRTQAEAPPQPRRRHRHGAPPWLPIGITLGVLALAVVAFRACSSSSWMQGPQHYVDLARAQYLNSRFEEALASLDFALREATGATREQALALQRDVRQTMVTAANSGKVRAARAEQELLLGFRDRYLAGAPARPAARELVRQCEGWLQRHGEICRADRDGQQLLAEVEALQQRFRPASGLPAADGPDDVVFAAQARLRFIVREYKAAVALLDAFLAAHPDDLAVRAARTETIASGEKWLRERLQAVERFLGRGDRARAETELRQLERHSVLPEWEPLVAPVRERLK